MKVLFIGGTGNISLSVSQRILTQGHDLWLLNRSGLGELAGAKHIVGDIHRADEKLKHSLFAHTWDVIVNWVAFTPEDVMRDIAWFQGKTRQYFFISSASCYNTRGSGFITERTPLENPYWQYSRDKIAAERVLQSAYETQQFPVTIVRPSHTYSRVIPLTIGGWHEYTAVSRMKAGRPVVVQGDGTSVWTLTHAEDFALGFCGLLGNSQAIGEDFHITSDNFLSWNDIYQQTAEAVGVEAKIIHVTSDKICALKPEYTGTLLGDKSVSAIFDNTKIKKFVPAFQAQIPYREGIRSTLAWFAADARRQYINPKTAAFIETLVAQR